MRDAGGAAGTPGRPAGGEHGQPGAGTARARVGVVGATGFAGALAAALLWRHPRVELAAISGRSEVGSRLADVHPRYRVPLRLEQYSRDRFAGLDVVCVAYPHGAAAPVVEELLEAGARVVDLSADFRLRELEAYNSFYGEHGAPGLVGESVYGIPELHRVRIAGARLVAVAGCYPTAALLALAPLVRAGGVRSVVVDAKSGVSGAGRAATARTHFVAVDENVSPYAVEGHRHHPEMVQELRALGYSGPVTFVPHLVPLDQGLLATCYVETERSLDAEALATLFTEAYGGEAFIEVVDGPPGVREVRDTNFCRLHASVGQADRSVIVLAAIDNLWKGAAGQAVQVLNAMLGLAETEGL